MQLKEIKKLSGELSRGEVLNSDLEKSSSGNHPKEVEIILSTGRDDRLYFPIRIGRACFQGLYDSGASSCVIGYKGWKKLNIGVRELEESDRIISVADGRKHEVLGAIRIPVSFDKVTMPVEFLEVPSLPHELMLGIDFCFNFRVVVDVYDRSAYSKLKKGEYEYGVQERVSDSTLKGIECKIEEVLVSYENLENEQADIINKLIARYKPTLGRDGLGCTDLYEHKIDTGDAPPKRSKYFSYSPKMLQVIHEGLDEYLKLGIIEPSVSAWSSPVIVLPKAEPGKYRWVVNLHEVNKVAKPDSYSPFKVN